MVNFFVSAFIFISTPAFADYKIILKNGSDFIVEDYKEADGRIKFYRAGGEIEIDRDMIETIKKIKPARIEEGTSLEETKKETAEKTDSPEKAQADPAKKKAAEDRLREISKRKEDMRAESEKLNEEKKKIEDEIKTKGRVIYPREEREFKHRISETEEKINKFNDELSKLDREQERLLKEAEGR